MLVTVNAKGQVTLPKPLRDQLGIRTGTKVDFELKPDGTARMRVLTRGASNLFGLLATPGARERSIEDYDVATVAAVQERLRR